MWFFSFHPNLSPAHFMRLGLVPIFYSYNFIYTFVKNPSVASFSPLLKQKLTSLVLGSWQSRGRSVEGVAFKACQCICPPTFSGLNWSASDLLHHQHELVLYLKLSIQIRTPNAGLHDIAVSRTLVTLSLSLVQFKSVYWLSSLLWYLKGSRTASILNIGHRSWVLSLK